MSGGPGTCSECQGKFGPGPLCVTCEGLVRLRLFVVSGRCPGAVGWFLAQRVRECHRAVLEEAERHWAGQPVRPADPPGLHSTGKAPPQSPPPLASGAGGTGEPEGSPKGTPAKNRVASEGRVAERSTAPEVRESRHRHSSKSRGRKRKRRERSRSRSVPVVAERPETLSSPRVKKEKAESDTPPVAAREESAESEEASLASEASPEENWEDLPQGLEGPLVTVEPELLHIVPPGQRGGPDLSLLLIIVLENVIPQGESLRKTRV